MSAKNALEDYEKQIEKLRKELAEYRSAVAELQLLNEIAVTAGASTDVDQTLQQIVQRSVRSLRAEQGSIHLLTGDEEEPLRTLVRQDDRSRLKHHYDFKTFLTGWVLKYQEPLLVTDLSKDDRFTLTADERREIRTAICTPIWFEGTVIGLLTMLNRKDVTAFTPNDLTLLSIVSVQAGQLIKNAQLREEGLREREAAAIARLEAEKLQEIDRLKSRFFTSIAHELRTPLSLIMGPLELLVTGRSADEPQRQYALMHQQAARLLRRINDLLALATIDAGVMTLEVGQCDIEALARRITASFASAAADKMIDLRCTAERLPVDAFCDSEKVETILTNLVANAVKFTRTGGRIDVGVFPGSSTGESGPAVELVVEDTGIGIAPEEQGRIFERFKKSPGSRLAESAGIGLALVKELVDLHFAEIALSSSPGSGTKFTVRIPVSRSFYDSRNIAVRKEHRQEPSAALQGTDDKNGESLARNVESSADESGAGSSHQILVVEDDVDLRRFIREVLAKEYIVLEAPDGDSGLAIAFDGIPDLVVSDVLMPGLDGLTLSRRLRTDERTSHVPIILLTSKAELESRLQGLDTGADDYIAKPFSPRELLTRIRNLLDQRRRLREVYRRQVVLEPTNIEITSADEAFLRRSMKVIDVHLGDADFSVEQFAREVGLSKTHLNRKLNALTDQSANEFVRSYRLKRAAKLLEGRKGNVSEIAFEVGFNNPSYFAESFRGLFGCSPSEYVKGNSPSS